MFAHVFKYQLKSILRDKFSLLWLAAFPMLLIVIFTFTMSNIDTMEEFTTKIKLDIVETNQGNPLYQGVERMFDDTKMNDYFSVSYIKDIEEAQERLDRAQTDAYMIFHSSDPKDSFQDSIRTEAEMVLNTDEFGSSTIISVFEGYFERYNVYFTVRDVMEGETVSNITYQEFIVPSMTLFSGDIPKQMTLYIYVVLAMGAFSAIISGRTLMSRFQSAHSDVARRMAISPMKRNIALLAVLFALLLFQFIITILLVLFCRYVAGISLGGFGYVLLLYMLCALCGIILGALLSLMITKKPSLSDGVAQGLIILFAGLAGITSYDIRFFIMEKLPPLHWINPQSLMVDSFYQLAYKTDLSVYWQNIGIMAILAMGMATAAVFLLRRSSHEFF